MAADPADISHGITIAFATSAFVAEITDVTPPGATRESIDTSHQGTTDWKTATPADLAEWGELSFTIHFRPSTDPPVDGLPESITITFPDTNTWVFTGFMTGYEPSAPHLDKMTADVTVKVDGDVTFGAVTPVTGT